MDGCKVWSGLNDGKEIVLYKQDGKREQSRQKEAKKRKCHLNGRQWALRSELRWREDQGVVDGIYFPPEILNRIRPAKAME